MRRRAQRCRIMVINQKHKGYVVKPTAEFLLPHPDWMNNWDIKKVLEQKPDSSEQHVGAATLRVLLPLWVTCKKVERVNKKARYGLQAM